MNSCIDPLDTSPLEILMFWLVLWLVVALVVTLVVLLVCCFCWRGRRYESAAEGDKAAAETGAAPQRCVRTLFGWRTGTRTGTVNAMPPISNVRVRVIALGASTSISASALESSKDIVDVKFANKTKLFLLQE